MIREERLRYKYGVGYRLFQIANIAGLTIFGFVVLYPLIYTVSISISDLEEVMFGRVQFLPRGFSPIAYQLVLRDAELGRAYLNTIIYTLLGTAVTLFICICAAYPLSIRRLKGRRFFNVAFVVTLFFVAGIIPNYIVVKSLGLIDSIWGVVLPPSFSSFYILILRTAFKAIPDSLTEAAYMDGAGPVRIIIRVALPLAKPTLAAIGMFAAISYWNNYLTPLLYLQSQSKFPLTIMLRKYLIESIDSQTYLAFYQQSGLSVAPGLKYALKMATIVVSILPIMMVYPFVQKYFVKGVMIGSVKG